MNRLVYILVTVMLFLCASNSIAQDKKDVKKEKIKVKTTKNGKPKIEIPPFGDPSDNELANTHLKLEVRTEPGTMDLTGSVIQFYKDKEICGRSFKGAIHIKVNKILKSGSGIVNPISAEQEITLGFLNGSIKGNINALEQKFNKDQNVFFVVQESLCQDDSQTVYEIKGFKIKQKTDY